MDYTIPLTSILILSLCFISLCFIRINLIGLHLYKAIRKYGKRNIDLIYAGQEDLMFDIKKLDMPLFQYIQLTMTFTKWTFKDFFPDL